jgi:hypothetical protein
MVSTLDPVNDSGLGGSDECYPVMEVSHVIKSRKTTDAHAKQIRAFLAC